MGAANFHRSLHVRVLEKAAHETPHNVGGSEFHRAKLASDLVRIDQQIALSAESGSKVDRILGGRAST